MTSTMPELLTTEEAARLLKRAPRTLEDWRGTGKGPPFVRQEGRVVYAMSDLVDWLKANTVRPGADGADTEPASREGGNAAAVEDSR